MQILDTNNGKLEKVAEILGLLEEKGKNKDWMLDELKRLKIKLRVSPTSNSYEILRNCSTQDIRRIHNALQGDFFGIEEVKAQTKTLHWFFTDIVGSSNPKISTKSQIRKINLLQAQIRNTNIFKEAANRSVVLPTGDGMAIGFVDSPETPLRLAIQLHQLLGKYNKSRFSNDKIAIRVGIDTGPVYFIKDVMGNDTVWGPGIISARRIMDLCGTNQIFVSQKIGHDISRLSSEYKAILHPIGDYVIKHGEQILIYNVYGKGFGNKFSPKKGKIVEKAKPDDFEHPIKFEFNAVELRLEVLDEKTMLTHHTWIWDVKNTTKEPLSQVYYDIAGDVPKDFSDLNVSIKDGDGKNLEIMSLDVNKGYEKKFNVKLTTPIRKNQKGRLVLEYDWEEPERVFEYVFSARCKKFKYFFSIPRKVQIKNMILEVVPGLGMKKRAEPPPKIKFSSDKTIITWETKEKQKINRFSAYEFKW